MTEKEAIELGFVPIKEYEDYLINSKGMIFSKKRNKLLSLIKGNNGYLHVKLSNKNGAKSFRVHRLVAETFIPNPYQLPMVNHIDENKDNNNADNLEWCTREYNLNYGTAMQRKVKNTDYYEISKKRSVALEKQVLQFEYDGTLVALWKNAQIASEHGYTRSMIQKCCIGEKHSHKGYIWKYSDFDYEKQIAKKPLNVTDSIEDLRFDWTCPTCERQFVGASYGVNHCVDCGQKIDWEGVE